MIEKSRKKGEQIVKYGPLGLALFVCIPLPGTGVWTGSLIAYLLGFKTTVAIISLSSGAALAGIIVTMMSVGAVHTLGLTVEWLVGIIVVIFLLAFLVKLFKK